MDINTFFNTATNTEIMLVVTAAYTIINFGITFWLNRLNYNHLRKKDFQDSLYKAKFETYRKLIELSHRVFREISITNVEFNSIYKLPPGPVKTASYRYVIEKYRPLVDEIEMTVFNDMLFLSEDVINLTIGFSSKYKAFMYMFNSEDGDAIMLKDLEVSKSFNYLWNQYRKELGIAQIEKGLTTRLDNSRNTNGN